MPTWDFGLVWDSIVEWDREWGTEWDLEWDGAGEGPGLKIKTNEEY